MSATPPFLAKSTLSDALGDLSRDQLVSLLEVGVGLASERNVSSLLEQILFASMDISNADGGTVYMVNHSVGVAQDAQLDFHIVRNISLGVHMGGTSDQQADFPSLRLFDDERRPIVRNVAAAAYHKQCMINVRDAYNSDGEVPGVDFTGTMEFDRRMNYRSMSFLVMPLVSRDGNVIGVIQLINAKNRHGDVIPFSDSMEVLFLAFSGQASAILEVQLSKETYRELWQSLMRVLATTIDQKSPFTSRHCQRVPILSRMIADSISNDDSPSYQDVHFSEENLEEMETAALLHDIGKITTPEHLIDKSTKLETVFDRIHCVRMRFEILLRDEKIRLLEWQLAGQITSAEAQNQFEKYKHALTQDWEFVGQCNSGSNTISQEDIERLQSIGLRQWWCYFDRKVGVGAMERRRIIQSLGKGGSATATVDCYMNLLQDLPENIIRDEGIKDRTYDRGELRSLMISKGTLSEEERLKVQEHVEITIQMLNALPLPANFSNVIEYAGRHHEKINGQGYPDGIPGYAMSLPARILCVADIFEAITASDRPYRPPHKLSQCIEIIYKMAWNNHIDRSIFQLILRSGLFQRYADKHMDPALIDEVDVQRYLSEAAFSEAPSVPVGDAVGSLTIKKDAHGLPLSMHAIGHKP